MRYDSNRDYTYRWMYFTLSSIFTAVGLFVIYKYKNSKIIKFLTCS